MPEAGTVQLEELVRRLASRSSSRSEADVQSDVQTLLLYGGLNLEDPQVRLETPAPGRRRIDVEVGHAVIECKRDLSVGNVRTEGIDQLAGYVRDRTRELGQRYVGVLTDGATWEVFTYNQASDALTSVARYDVAPASPDVLELTVWLEAVLSTASRLEPVPTEVERRLGADSPGSRLDLAELADIYEQCRNEPEVKMKRELWARLLAAAFGTHFQDTDSLFIEHTYLVLTAEVIAHAVMGFQLVGGGVDVRDLVTGAEFRSRDIHGVVEADFFDWPVHTDQGVSFVEGLTRRLVRFEWSHVEHDVLKVLYESVIDADTRRQLGEYYTPDWLAERMVREVIDNPLEQRVLDPACGSGTFLFWAVRAYLNAADAAGVSNRDALAGVTEHVSGIDLHPVAVTLARVTYLLAMGPDRLQDRDALSIPIYLGDSIQYAQDARVLSPGGITVYTTDGLELFEQALMFPEAVVADAGRFDQLVEELAFKASDRRPNTPAPSIRMILNRHEVPPDARPVVEQSFRVLCHLHDHGRNHIWGYYIRNLARPLEFTRPEHRIDRLIGNPPWLKYNAMPSGLQAEFKRLSQARRLWAGAHVVTSQDLAGLFVARTMELYLRPGGRFGFVMPAAALSRPQYDGFRHGSFSSEEAEVGAAFELPWELSGVRPQPFPVPASVVFGIRAPGVDARPMPRRALWWSGRVDDHYRSWSEVADRFTITEGPVVVADSTMLSPYGDLVRQGANLVPRVLLTVVEQPPTALGVPAGRVAVRSDRSSPEREPWNALPTLEGVVEERFVYPMILGESLLPFRIREPRSTVIPHDGEDLYEGSGMLIDAFPGLAEWWRRVERLYDDNKPDTTQHDLIGQINYQSKLKLQFPIAPHRVAYTGRGSTVNAARIRDERVIVDHALYWAPVSSADEGRYLCGILNSAPLANRIEDALSRGLFGARNIHRAPFRVEFPEYDPGDTLHQRVVDLASHAEEVASAVDLEGVTHTATARRRVKDALGGDGVSEELDRTAGILIGDVVPED